MIFHGILFSSEVLYFVPALPGHMCWLHCRLARTRLISGVSHRNLRVFTCNFILFTRPRRVRENDNAV